MTTNVNPGKEVDFRKEANLEKALREGKILGADLSHGKDMAGLPSITLNVKNLHLHFDERMDSRTYYGRNPWEDDSCDGCCGCDEEDCGDYDGYEEDYGEPVADADEDADDFDEEDPFHKSFSIDEIVESVHDETGLCRAVIADILERHRAARKPEPTVKPAPAAEHPAKKGAGYEHR